ncbi:MAG: methyltransferase domain-containing protein [Acidimicrobiales bacterium]|jgi:ubiquinone/menaquinone biosynthesis C-methylase UbiE
MPRFDFEATFGEDYLHFYLPHLTEERNLAETNEIIDTLSLQSGERVLDVPCGHGRISNLLAVRGLEVTGVDASALFLDKARHDASAAGVSVRYESGDMRQLPMDGPFDAVVCWYTSFGYFDDDDNRRVLSEFRRVLRPGGRLLIETIHRDGFVRDFTPSPFASIEQVGDDMTLNRTTFDPDLGGIQTERMIVRDGRVRTHVFSVRLPTVPEFRQWLSEAGFSSSRFEGRNGEVLDLNSRRLVVLAYVK